MGAGCVGAEETARWVDEEAQWVDEDACHECKCWGWGWVKEHRRGVRGGKGNGAHAVEHGECTQG